MTNRWQTPTLALACAAAATAALGGPLRAWLTHSQRLDVPNHRSSHRIPTPRGGGLACLLGASASLWLTNTRLTPRVAISVLGLSAVGYLDDVTGHVPAPVRLAGQLVAGAAGFSDAASDVPVSAITTAGVVNVFNFMDGINGISGLTATIWGLNALVMDDEGDGTLAKLGALTAGAGLGFLPYNFPKAQVFLGDVGSYAFGAALAAGILSQQTAAARYRAAAPLLLYAADASQALLHRMASRAPIGEAHRDHIYQRLVDSGHSHAQVAVAHAIGAALITAASRGRAPVGTLITLVIVAAYLRSPQFKCRNQASVRAVLDPETGADTL